MLEKDHLMEIPVKQRMERQETIVREHTEEYKAALKRAVTLDVPHAYSPSQYGTFDELEEGQDSYKSDGGSSASSSQREKKNESWDVLIERLYDKDESGHMILKKSHRQED